MSEPLVQRPVTPRARLRRGLAHAQTLMVLGVLGLLAALRQRWDAARESGDSGDVTQTAVLTAIGLLLAVGLAAAITSVVNKYQAQIK